MADKTMTRDELLRFNGRNGQPAYVAVGSTIYDVSASPLWQEGTHAELHQAGHDLSLELKAAPHVAALIQRFPSVARLAEEPRQKPGAGTTLILAAAAAIALILVLTWLH